MSNSQLAARSVESLTLAGMQCWCVSTVCWKYPSLARASHVLHMTAVHRKRSAACIHVPAMGVFLSVLTAVVESGGLHLRRKARQISNNMAICKNMALLALPCCRSTVFLDPGNLATGSRPCNDFPIPNPQSVVPLSGVCHVSPPPSHQRPLILNGCRKPPQFSHKRASSS
jgi:hypothetical protein